MRTLLCCSLLMLTLSPGLFGWGRQEAAIETEQDAEMRIEVGQVREITGRLRVVGNEPFAQLVITLEQDPGQGGLARREQSFAIMDELHDELWRLQQQTVTLQVTVLALPQPGMPGAVQVHRILSPENQRD